MALVAAIIVYNKVIQPKEATLTGPKGGAVKELLVNGFIIKPTNINNSIIASGTLLANEEVELHPEVQGKIITLNLNEGTAVTKGTLLVKLYDADLQAQLKKLVLQKDIAEKTEKRLTQLLAINGIGQQEFDNAKTQYNNIVADMEILQAQIYKTEIRAPFSGVVGLKNVSVGAFISTTTTIATLQQINPLKVDFTIPEKYAATVAKGNVIHFTVDGFSETFTGKVYAIEPKIEEATRSIKVRAQVQNSSAKLLPGAFAKVDLGLKNLEGALLVPSQCILPEARTKKVIVIKNGIATFTVVETGIRTDSYIQIVKGAQVGDTIVATALMYVKPNGAVKVNKIIE